MDVQESGRKIKAQNGPRGHGSPRASPVAKRAARPALTLQELIDLRRPVTVEELNAALPFLSRPSIRRLLIKGDIPGVKITKNRWAVARQYLIRLSEQENAASDREG